VNELTAYTNFLTRAPKDKIVSIVIDSYHDEVAVKELLGGKLKNLILERTAPTVFRPDSGNPVTKSLDVITWLWECFGGTVNEKGFKVLDPHVKVIYGDGINLTSIDQILKNIVDNGFSIQNICFGMGGKLLQGVDRDSFQVACKACAGIVDGKEIEIYKDPHGNTGKNSKRGKLKLIKIDGIFNTVKQDEYPDHQDYLIPFFLDGELLVDQTFEEIRTLASTN
jgi:nicotinamide phosphoribosyltransferase